METLIIQPESIDKLETVKAVLKALKVNFITQKEGTNGQYSDSFISKMKQGDEDKKAGRYKTIKTADLWK